MISFLSMHLWLHFYSKLYSSKLLQCYQYFLFLSFTQFRLLPHAGQIGGYDPTIGNVVNVMNPQCHDSGTSNQIMYHEMTYATTLFRFWSTNDMIWSIRCFFHFKLCSMNGMRRDDPSNAMFTPMNFTNSTIFFQTFKNLFFAYDLIFDFKSPPKPIKLSKS